MNAGTLISAVLNEGRKAYSAGYTNLVSSRNKIERRVGKYVDLVKDDPSSLSIEKRDYSYGLGRSRNRHLNAVVRHILPSLGDLLHSTHSEYSGGSGYTDTKNEFLNRSYRDHRTEAWEEYDRHLNDLANHIDKHAKRMRKKLFKARGSGFEAPNYYDLIAKSYRQKVHDLEDHRNYGFDNSELGEICTAHVDGTAGGENNISMIHKSDAETPNMSKERLVAMLDKFYRGKEWAIRKRASRETDPFQASQELIHNTPWSRRIVAASRQISIPKGWKVRGL